MATNTNSDETLADKVAMGLSGGLLILGVVVTGLIEVFSGAPYSPVREVVENGRVSIVVNEGATIAPNIRAGLILISMIVLLVFAIYAFATQQHLYE